MMLSMGCGRQLQPYRKAAYFPGLDRCFQCRLRTDEKLTPGLSSQQELAIKLYRRKFLEMRTDTATVTARCALGLFLAGSARLGGDARLESARREDGME